MRLLTLALIALLLSGCVYSREISGLRGDIEDAIEADLDRQIVLTLGPRMFNSLGWMARRVPDLRSHMVADYVSDIRRVKVGVYELDGDRNEERLRIRAIPRLNESGWQSAVRVEEEDETVWVMTRERYGDIRDVLVVVVSYEDIVLVRLEGNLNAMVARAVSDEAFIRDLAGL